MAGPNVFLCHRKADDAITERLAVELRDSGCSVWFDEWEINVGDSVIERMNTGLTGASYLILCYSDKGVTAPWISAEWMNTLARQLNGENVKILPARLTGGNPPALLAAVKYADLVKDWDKGVRDLLKAMGIKKP